MSQQETQCVIVGGGPAGMIAALLLARGGVSVTVLEKHADFLRDFRGDTVHPSTIALLDELGLYQEFTELPQLARHRPAGSTGPTAAPGRGSGGQVQPGEVDHGGPLRENRFTVDDLAAVQGRRIWPTRIVQAGQIAGHRLVLDRVLAGKRLNGGNRLLSMLPHLLTRFPQLSVVPAYAMGVGVRPEPAPEFARRSV